MTTTENTTRPSNNTITRRKVLQSVAAVSVISLSSVAIAEASPSTSAHVEIEHVETPELITALAQLSHAKASLAEAKNDLDWLEAEWGYRWPLAPEEILGSANCQRYCRDDTVIEVDFLGRPLVRETVELTKRLSKEWRKKNERTCFALNTPAELRSRIRDFETRTDWGRTEKSRTRNYAQALKWNKENQQALALGEAYFSEIARITDASGVQLAKQKVEDAGKAVEAAYLAIAKATATTMLGIRAKALAFVESYGTVFGHCIGTSVLTHGYGVALSVVHATRPANGYEWPPIAATFHSTIAELGRREAIV